MLSLPGVWIKYGEIVFQRAMIYTFIFLTLEFSRMFISASAATHPYMAMWGDILFGATTILIFALLFGQSCAGRDINTLDTWALLAHLIYIPCYASGLQVAEYHNLAIKVINAVIVVRLFYFGQREFFVRISIIELAKNWLLTRHPASGAVFNRLTLALFVLCAIPLFTLIYLINTDRMTISGIAIVLFAFYVATSPANRPANPAPRNPEAAISGRFQIRRGMLKELRMTNWILTTILILTLLVGWVILGVREKVMFHLGYSAGYQDGKSGAQPKMEVNWERLIRCYGFDGYGKPPPPDPACKLDEK